MFSASPSLEQQRKRVDNFFASIYLLCHVRYCFSLRILPANCRCSDLFNKQKVSSVIIDAIELGISSSTSSERIH